MSADRGARVLVVGASGLVGSRVLARLGATGVGTYHTHERDDLLELDIVNTDRVRTVIAEVVPRAVVLTAGWTHVDGCERDPERSRTINVEGTRNVAEAAAAHGARMVFVSSDYVFGDGGPHHLDAPCAPLNVYGEHKLAAERIVAETVESHAIVRTCNVYGYDPVGKNFVMAVLRCGKEGTPMRVPSDQWGNPTHADDLAAVLAALAHSAFRGTLHVAGPDYLDRPTWARRTAEAFGLAPTFIEPVPTADLGQAARRALHGGLDSSGLASAIGMRCRTLAAGLAEVAAAVSESR